MCGIVGLFLPRSAPPRTAPLDRMLATIAHRGPDGRQTWVSEDGRYQCGFARLAIIDLATGDQPLVEEGGRRVLTGNGEIYNYLELRRELDYPWRTRGDMEPVLPLHDRYGDEFVHHLNGMYGLALYERDRHRLILVRDRLGVKPLYWARVAGGGILFASEIKPLLASGLVEAAIDEAAAAAYLAHGYVPAPATLYRGIAKLPPGHRLVADAEGGVTVSRYWAPSPAADLPTGADAIRDHLLGLLDDAVGLQMRSDVPVGALLSGGLDSGLVVALAAAKAARPLRTYTVRFEGAPVDESPLAAAVAARYGTDHTTFDLSALSIAEHLPTLAWLADEPLADASLLPNYLIEKALGGAVRVVLNGTGGDELFAGYGRHFPTALERRWLRVPAPLRRAAEAALATVDPWAAWKLARGAKAEADPGGYVHDHSTYFPAAIRALIGSRLGPAAPAQVAACADFGGPAQTRRLVADLGTYLPDDLLCLLDRTSMGASVEGRVPFLDHRLVEAALAVPPSIRAPGGRPKGLERAMAARLLPPEVLAAPKQGFASPVGTWLRHGLAKPVRLLLTSAGALERGWWSAAGIDRLLADPARHGHRLYALLMLELAVRLHVEAAPLDTPPTASLSEIADAA